MKTKSSNSKVINQISELIHWARYFAFNLDTSKLNVTWN